MSAPAVLPGPALRTVASAGLAPSAESPARRKAPLWMELIISGTSVGGATTVTNPLDVIKTRLQLYTCTNAAVAAPGLVQTGVGIVHTEGVLGLWKGLSPSVARGFVYGGLRLGLYGPCKDVLLRLSEHSGLSSSSSAGSAGAGAGAAGVGLKVAAGTVSGALAAGLTSPTELVKTRLQAKDCTTSSSMEVARQVVHKEGVVGLWRGAVPSMARAGLLTASQCATYDEVKHAVMGGLGWADDTTTHVASSAITGLVTTTVTNPADVIKTRMFVGTAGAAQRSVLQTASDVLKADGLLGFFKGWTANYARLGPQTMITFLISEGLRKALDVQGL